MCIVKMYFVPQLLNAIEEKKQQQTNMITTPKIKKVKKL